MANYAILKAAIASAIQQNGNNEITGQILQQQLLAMVNSLGGYYQFAGIATPTTNPGTPDENIFYLAATAGTYTNFGGLVLNDGEIATLNYNGEWTKDVLGEVGGGGGVGGGLVAVVEEGFYIVDENLNIGAYLDEEGWHAINVLEYTIVNR